MTIKTVETENEGLKRAFMLTIPAEDIEARVEQEVKRIAPQVRMPGFRPGKVPPNLIRKMHGDACAATRCRARSRTASSSCSAEQKIRPAMQPQVELDEAYEPGKDAEVNVRLEALPDVPPPQIDGLKLDRLTVEPTMARSTSSSSRSPARTSAGTMRRRSTRLPPAISSSSTSKARSTASRSKAARARTCRSSSARAADPGLRGPAGRRQGGRRARGQVTFPADYPVDDLAGKDATFAVIVKAVKTAGETKVDDDFAKSLGLAELEQLRGLIRDQIEQELNGLTRTHMKRQLLDQLAAPHDFAVPQSMVEAEYQNILAPASPRGEPRGRSRSRAGRDREGCRRLSPHRRAPRPPRPAAVGNRRRQRRRGHRAGDERG